MVRDYEEIERARKASTLAAGRCDLLTFGKTIGVVRSETAAERASIHGIGCVEMGVAPIHALRKVAIHVRGIGGFLGESFLQVFMRRSGFLSGS
jgi:hypothetical protein